MRQGVELRLQEVQQAEQQQRLLLRASLAVLDAFAVSGCAIFESENRRTLNALEAPATPSSAAARWALAPLALRATDSARVCAGVSS
jgi:hypothetical protein